MNCDSFTTPVQYLSIVIITIILMIAAIIIIILILLSFSMYSLSDLGFSSNLIGYGGSILE